MLQTAGRLLRGPRGGALVSSVSARVLSVHATGGSSAWEKDARPRIEAQPRGLALLGGALGLSLAGLALYGVAEQPAGQDAARPGAAKAGAGAAGGAEKRAAKAKKLPEFSRDEVRKHTSEAAGGIWVTYQGNVYDITEFSKGHPGGAKILLAAGGPVEPFWNLYAVHKNPEVAKLLEPLRIGTLKASEQGAEVATADPYAKDPERHPALKVNSAKPFNAEPPSELLVESWVTPNELFFKRNHLPVPDIKPEDYALEVEVEGLPGGPIRLSLEDLRTKFKQYSIPVTLQCAGNRRSELHAVKPVKGLSWGTNAISNAVWTGVKLRDVLRAAGVSDDFEDQGLLHVHFEGLDRDITNQNYGASVPLAKAMDPRGDVLLAFEMNGQPLPKDHGFPVRAVVPGTVGARNVKWLGKIKASKQESANFWQQRDYKGFNPSIDWHNVNFDTAPAIQDLPIQSSITMVEGVEEGAPVVKGYAYSGGGRGIIRVDVSVDGGQTWSEAVIKEGGYQPGNYTRTWTWALWEYHVPEEALQGKATLQVVAKATDTNYNVQPEHVQPYWNLRGVLANSWPRVTVQLPQAHGAEQ